VINYLRAANRQRALLINFGAQPAVPPARLDRVTCSESRVSPCLAPFALESASSSNRQEVAAIDSVLDSQFSTIAKAIADGRAVPFLGAGANLCDRPSDRPWTSHSATFLPSGAELAAHLAQNFDYPAGEPQDLARVSQYVAVMAGSGPLYEELHDVLDSDFQPTPLHHFLAGLPRRLREKGFSQPHQLIVTTNYDDVLERAFKAADEPVDVASYVADGEQRGKFLHWQPDGSAAVIDRPNEYRALSLDERSVILKIHGAVDRANRDRDSYVITEDHYIDYLTRTDVSTLIPVKLAAKLRKSHFLFLGYGLRDWNLRVILHRIWGEQKLKYRSWAIQLNPQHIDREFWRQRDVDIIDSRLEQCVSELDARIGALPPIQGAA
jgi:hypothetical protein